MENKPVTFDPITHTYKDKEGNILISCSQLLSKYKEPFDPDGSITAKYALKNGLTVEEVKAKWKQENIQSCDYGTSVHNELEYFIHTGEIRDSPYEHFVVQFSKLSYGGKVFSERMLYSLEHMIAGTADLIEKGGNLVNIDDFKTNKKLEKYSPWGKCMLHEVSHLEDCNFNHYQLQLSIYGYMCELAGLTVNRLRILYFNPITQLLEVHIAKYLRNEVINILNNKRYLL